jgi:DNA-binding SARP family transcriptional activator
MEFRILGPLEAVEDGRLLELGGPKQRALLAVLLLEANRVVSSGRLVDALWEEDPPETAQKVLQVYVSQLRKLLGKQRLETKAPGYLLHVEADELDLARFQRLQGEGSLQEALSLWRGQPLAEFADQRFAQAEIARLEELRLACLEEQVERNLDLGLLPSWLVSLRGWFASIRFASGCVASSCWRSTVRGVRRRRWRSIKPLVERLLRSWGLSRVVRCASCTRRSSTRIRPSTSLTGLRPS